MHDHSRFQRDIDWRHRRLSLSLSQASLSLSLSLLLTKVTHAQYRKRFRVSYNNLLLNSCYLGWILRKDLEFSKSSIFKRKKKWSHKDFAAERTWTGTTRSRSRILGLSTWAICELTNAAGKRSIKSVRPQRTTVQALQFQALAKHGRRQEAFVSHFSSISTILILKTIGNRKGDCAWSCSRWQTQPEKICKSQRTNQCHSLRTLYWFVRCDLQIFSGCVCHLEQLHAQSPFLFPIVFSINLIPFFDICSEDYLLFFHPGCSGMCCFTWAAARSQQYTLLSKRQASCLYNHALEHSTACTRRRVRSTRKLMVLGKSRQAHQRTIMHSNTRQAANNHALEHSTGSERVDAFGLCIREMVLGKSREAHQRTAGSPANAKLTFRYPSSLINHSPCCSSAQAPSFLSFTRAQSTWNGTG